MQNTNTTIQRRTKAWWRIYAPLYRVVIGSYNGLSPVPQQAIAWNNTDSWTIRRKVSRRINRNKKYSLEKICFKMSPAKCRPFCLCVYVFQYGQIMWTIYSTLWPLSPWNLMAIAPSRFNEAQWDVWLKYKCWVVLVNISYNPIMNTIRDTN